MRCFSILWKILKYVEGRDGGAVFSLSCLGHQCPLSLTNGLGPVRVQKLVVGVCGGQGCCFWAPSCQVTTMLVWGRKWECG